ncbi:hypothetical protein [Pediococcus damnosus]|uniref:hypothetical protein n=1 Tax=Pediococcus damnosus TaxID=51663 RepID=UPI003F6C8733
MNLKRIFRNIAYSLSSNLLTLIVSAMVILIVPKLIGVKEYGYFQLYIFLTSYVGLFPLGWIDGIYLRYGGKNYKELNKKMFHSQLVMYMFSQICIAGVIALFSFEFVNDPVKRIIVLLSCVCLIFFNIRAFILFVLQATNRIKSYANILVQDRIIYLVLIIFFLLFKKNDFTYLILADLIAKGWTMFYALFICGDISSRKISFFWSFHETWLNISSGVKLLFANFAALLIVGSIRFAIEKFWGVVAFGKVSLTLSISNLAMTFISAVSLVLFPLLKRSNKKHFKNTYINLRTITLVFLFLFLYYPISVILPLWLPKYAQSLTYLSVLFPICFYEGKFELLTNTFMKSLRLESKLLMINCISVALSLFFILLDISAFHSLNFMVFSIIIVLAFRSSLGEGLVSHKLNVPFIRSILGENLMVALFVGVTWNQTLQVSLISYAIAFVIYLWTNKNGLQKSIKNLRRIAKEN